MSVCCTGIACITVAATLAPIADALADAVHFYGGEENLKRVANMVYHEQDIFTRAVNAVNSTISPKLIQVNLTLLDIIIANVPRTGSILEQSMSVTMRLFKSAKQEYCKAVWDMYVSMGGNYKVIVYGLIEYMCQIYEPTCDNVIRVVDNFNKNGPLRNECTNHKC